MINWKSEVEMEDFNIMTVINSIDYSFDDDEDMNFQPFSSYPIFTPKIERNFSNSFVENPQLEVEHQMPTKYLKVESIAPKPKTSSSSSSHIISFKNSSSPQPIFDLDCNLVDQRVYENQNCSRGTKRNVAVRSSLCGQDHVIAERKRREKLNQRFIALSAIVPGLKKKDKSSILGEATKYLKQLQEQVKTLEEQAAKKTDESAVFIRRSQISAIDDETSSSDENFDKQLDQTLLEIEAKASDKDVLIRIHCEKQKGIETKILSEIEKLHLTIINYNVLKFGNTTIDITVVAKMDVDYCMKVKELVENLRMALLKFM